MPGEFSSTAKLSKETEFDNEDDKKDYNKFEFKDDITCNSLLRPADSNGIVNVKFGFLEAREVKLSPSKYFNQILLNYSQKFASFSDYIFFPPLIMRKVQLTSSINIELKIEVFDSLVLSRRLVS